MATLLQDANLTGDGNTTAIPVRGRIRYHPHGDFGTGTATLQVSDDSGTAYDSAGSDFAFTADGYSPVLDLGQEEHLVRVNLNGSASPDLEVHIIQVGF